MAGEDPSRCTEIRPCLALVKQFPANLSVEQAQAIARKLGFPPWQEKFPRANPRTVRSFPAGADFKKIKKGNDHDAIRWRTQSPGAVDADAGAVLCRPARVSRFGDPACRPSGPLVQGVHGRDAGSSTADFSDRKPHHYAALGFWFGR